MEEVSKENCKKKVKANNKQVSARTATLRYFHAKYSLSEERKYWRRIVVFSDELFITLESVVNYQHDRVYVISPKNIPKCFKKQK